MPAPDAPDRRPPVTTVLDLATIGAACYFLAAFSLAIALWDVWTLWQLQGCHWAAWMDRYETCVPADYVNLFFYRPLFTAVMLGLLFLLAGLGFRKIATRLPPAGLAEDEVPAPPP